MMTTLLLLCLSVWDFQKPSVTDPLGKQFVVNDSLDNSATTGCTTNPSGGGPSNHFIAVDYVGSDDPHDAATTVSSISSATWTDSGAIPLVPQMMAHDPSNPVQPDVPPVAATPEPPTAAILAVSLGVLMYILFGRKMRRYYRRA